MGCRLGFLLQAVVIYDEMSSVRVVRVAWPGGRRALGMFEGEVLAELRVGDGLVTPAAVALAPAVLATTGIGLGPAAPERSPFHEHAVTRRLAALFAPPPLSRWLPAAIPAVLGLIAAVRAVDASREIGRMFDLAMHVWSMHAWSR
ncbi:hypothetical protein [Frankia sp. Cj3]|uniref:hypothetical protein n=1 Tax=Frankia sp. Cj3 TaxID=2880976 RepID=UPI001EF3E17A|nr:hypothetical protein [Frankia sp. Cj3]